MRLTAIVAKRALRGESQSSMVHDPDDDIFTMGNSGGKLEMRQEWGIASLIIPPEAHMSALIGSPMGLDQRHRTAKEGVL